MSEPADSTNMNAAPGAGIVTMGVGNATSGEAGSTLTHETMAETGGSGGDAMTKPNNAEAAPLTRGSGQPADIGHRDGVSEETDSVEGEGSDATATARGFQDTRSAQASPGNTGLGAPESGANQSESDLAPPRP